MAYHSVRGSQFGYDDSGAVLVGGRRLMGDGNPGGIGNGKTFYVSSAIAGSDGGSPGGAVGTLAAALALCTLNQGDTIVLLPNHAENITAATTFPAGAAGVRIIGLGRGANRPKLTFTTVNTSTLTIGVAGVYIENVLFVANFLSIAAAITLTTALDFTCVGCEFRDTAAATDFLNCIKGTGAANTTDGLTVTDSKWFGTGVTSVNSMILIADALNRVTLLRNRCVTERVADAPILLTQTTGAATNIDVGDNVVISKQTASTDGTIMKIGASSTGVVYRNFSGTLVTSSDKLFTTTVGVFPYENRVSGVVGATGFVMPAVDS